MDKKNKKGNRNLSTLLPLGYQLTIFLVQIVILIACIEYARIIYKDEVLPDKMVKDNFSQIACTVVSKKLSEKVHLVHSYRADFLISYEVNNVPYQTWVTGNGLDQDFFHQREPQETTLSQFQIGSAYTCWYDPKAPQIAVLVLRHDWISTLPLIIPTLIALIVIYYIIKGTLQFGGVLFNILRSSKSRFKK